jgi:hypothetical protein
MSRRHVPAKSYASGLAKLSFGLISSVDDTDDGARTTSQSVPDVSARITSQTVNRFWAAKVLF